MKNKKRMKTYTFTTTPERFRGMLSAALRPLNDPSQWFILCKERSPHGWFCSPHFRIQIEKVLELPGKNIVEVVLPDHLVMFERRWFKDRPTAYAEYRAVGDDFQIIKLKLKEAA